MKKFDKIFFGILLGVVVITHLYAYRVWLFSSGVLTQGDWILSLPNWSQSLLALPTIWKSYAVGSLDFTPPFYIFMLLEGFLSHFGVNYAYIERITFLWPIALLTLPLCYIFIKSYVKNSLAAFLGALVYTYNTYFLIIQTGHLTLMIGFALAPLALYLFKKTIDEKSLFHGLLSGLICFIISFFEFRAFYMLALIFGAYYLYFIFYLSPKKLLVSIKQSILYMLIPFIVVVVLNFYWIVPFVLTPPMEFGSVFNRDLFGKEFYNIARAFTLFHPYWTGGKYFPFIAQPTPFYFFLIPLLAFTGVYLNRKNKNILFIACLALVGIFLTKQDNAPFPFIYPLLYKFFPGFGAFREASKFYFYIALGYGVLIAVFFEWIWKNWQSGLWNIAKYLLAIIVVFLSLLNTKPIITGEFGTLFVTREMPQEYTKLNAYIDAKPDFFRTLWVPVDARWGSNTNLHPKIGEANVVTAVWKNFTDVSKYPTLGDQFIDFFNKPISEKLLNNTSVRYVIVPMEDIKNDDDFYLQFYKHKSDYINKLENTPYLHKINLGLPDITVFENTAYRPHIYTTMKEETLKNDVPFTKVQFQSVNTTKYTIHLTNIKNPVYLHFTDQYHPSWKIRVGEFHWFSSLFEKNYYLPTTIHSKSDTNFNEFRIDPAYISSHVDSRSFTKNADGTITMDLTLYFAPQASMLLATIISLIGFGLISILLFYSGVRKR